MSAVGRPLESVSINGREFQCVGDAAATRKLGGYEAEWQSNGNPATGRKILTPVGWNVPGQNLVIDSGLEDQEYVQSFADSATTADFVFNYGGGIVYQGTGTVVEELAFDPMTATMSVSFSGPGKLKQM